MKKTTSLLSLVALLSGTFICGAMEERTANQAETQNTLIAVAAVVSPTGEMVLVKYSDRTAVLFKITTSPDVIAVAATVSPDGKWILVKYSDGTSVLYDALVIKQNNSPASGG